jgi:hypothetical protein
MSAQQNRKDRECELLEFHFCQNEPKQFLETDEQKLRRLLALDRYERYAHTKRRRASVKLADVSAAE